MATPTGGNTDQFGYEQPPQHETDGNQQQTSVTSSSLSHALQGVMHNMTDRSVIGAIRSVRRSQYGTHEGPPSTPANSGG